MEVSMIGRKNSAVATLTKELTENRKRGSRSGYVRVGENWDDGPLPS
jgi:hypothetical protein